MVRSFTTARPVAPRPLTLLGTSSVDISSNGPIVLNSVSATGDVTISGESLLEGNAQSPNVIAPKVDLTASGTADYQGQVTFADSATGDTMTLPATITSNGTTAAGPPGISRLAFWRAIRLWSRARSPDADDGAFTIASISTDGYTLILMKTSDVLTPESQSGVTVGDGIIGQASAGIAFSDVPLFSATTANGDIYLTLGGEVNSIAQAVSAGGFERRWQCVRDERCRFPDHRKHHSDGRSGRGHEQRVAHRVPPRQRKPRHRSPARPCP